MNLSSSNANYKDLTNETKKKKTDKKTEVSIHGVSFDKRNYSVLVEEVADNELGRSLINSNQVLKAIYIKRAIVFFGGIIF